MLSTDLSAQNYQLHQHNTVCTQLPTLHDSYAPNALRKSCCGIDECDGLPSTSKYDHSVIA